MFIETPRLVPIQMIEDETGALGVIESLSGAPVSYQRLYFFKNVKSGAQRGGHAHKKLRQTFIALRGGVTIDLKKDGQCQTFRLDSCEEALTLPPGYWRDLYDFSEDALIGVLASDRYDEEDYIREWDDFVRWEQSQKTANVPYLDLSRYAAVFGPKIADAVCGVIESGPLIGGPEVAKFEASFAAYCGASEAIGVGNGLQALTLALRAAGVGPGQEVILPANTFIATALAVVEAGATPILVDVEEGTGLIDMALVEAAITERTRAVIPVHLYGHPCDMDRLAQIIGNRPIMVLEDAAQAHGALYKGRPCGSLGAAAAFSFYPTKNLGALGDAGCVTTNDPVLGARIRLLGNYGSVRKYEHLDIGTNSRLDPIQAAALGVKLPYLEGFNAQRSTHADTYLSDLAGLPWLALPQVHEWAAPVWHVFPVRISGGAREQFIAHLSENGVGSNIHYPTPVHLQPCFKSLGLGEGSFPVSEKLSRELVSLPLDPCHTPAEIARVVEVVRAFQPAAPSAPARPLAPARMS